MHRDGAQRHVAIKVKLPIGKRCGSLREHTREKISGDALWP
jgi:hypothetical protein